MILWTSISMLAGGLLGLFHIYLRRYEYNPRLAHLLGLSFIGIIGIALILSGVTAYSTSGALGRTIGTFIVLTGFQVLLWSAGIRLNLLGNQSTLELVLSPAHPALPSHRPRLFGRVVRHALHLTDDLMYGNADVPTPVLLELARDSRQTGSAAVHRLVEKLILSVERIRLSRALEESAAHPVRTDAIESLAEIRAELILLDASQIQESSAKESW